MRKGKKSLVLLLIFAMALSLFPQTAYAAKKKVKLNKKSVIVNVGKTVKIKLKNNKKKVKWSVTSGKKKVALSKKKKTGVTIKGKKAGKAKVQAKVGKKKYVCKVTVKKKKSATKTPKPTPVATQTPKPTKKPLQTMQPANQTPATAHPRQGLYAEEEDVQISSVKFDKEIEYYSLSMNTIFAATPEGQSAKEAMPDVKKCEYTVYSHGKKAEVKSISDVVWHDKSFYGDNTDSGYYTFKLTVEQGGKQYSAMANLVSYTESVEYYRVDNGLFFHTLIADGKEYELENLLTWKNNEINWQYYIKSDDVVLKDLIDTKEYKVVARYGDKDYTLDCVVDRYTLYNGNAYEFTHSTLELEELGNLRIGSSEDSFTVSDKKQDFYYILSYTSTKGNVNFDSDANLFEYQQMLDKGKSLKDIFTEFAKNLQIQQVAYRNKCYTNAVIENVVWNDESYYPGGGDNGYYSFDISLTVDGKKITQSYKLIEKEKKYTVSGVLKMEDGTPIPNIYLYVRKEGTEYSVVYTNDKGEYSFQASKGTYCFKAGESFTVDEGPLQKDITLPVCLLSGSIIRENAPAVDAGYWMRPTGENQIIYFGTDNNMNYWAYLEKGSYELMQGSQVIDTFEVTGSGTKDFTIKLYRITGKLAKKNLEFVDINNKKNTVLAFAYKGSYTVYLKPGTYDVLYNDITFDRIEVTSQDIKKDFSIAMCSGRILDATQTELPANRFDSYEIEIKKDGEFFKTIRLAGYLQDKGSGYEIGLPKGTYEFFFEENSLGSVTIADEDVEKDLCLPIRYVKFRVLDKQNNVIKPDSTIEVLNVDTNKQYWYHPKDKNGVLLLLGNYKVNSVEGLTSKGYEFSVTKDTELVDVATDVCRVSGTCRIVGEKGGKYQILAFKTNSKMIYAYPEDGKYEMFLEAGVYNFIITYTDEKNSKEHTLVRQEVTVPDAPYEKNFDIVAGSLSGQLTWKDGTSAMYGESSLCLYSDGFASGDITADLKADGSFSFSYVPYGTYTMKLDDKDIGTVTINSADKQQDYTINGYQIAVVVKEANGEFARDKWIHVEKDEKKEYDYVDNDKGLALVIVDEPGTYEVCSYDNGNRICYGTVTVTDENVSCALTAE